MHRLTFLSIKILSVDGFYRKVVNFANKFSNLVDSIRAMTLSLFPSTTSRTWFLAMLFLSVIVLLGAIMEMKRNNYCVSTTSLVGCIFSFLLASCTVITTTGQFRPIRSVNTESPILMLEKFRYRPNFAVYNHRGTVMHMNCYAGTL